MSRLGALAIALFALSACSGLSESSGDDTGDGLVPDDSLTDDTQDSATCGDGQVEGDEVCDGENLNGATCVSLGFSGGTLSCLDDCLGFFTAACSSGPACGNGVREANEQCDGSDFGGLTCEDGGFGGGNLQCNPDCTINTSDCDGLCTNTCQYANDGDCDDGGPNSDYSLCDLGTDCADCGPR